MELGNQPLYDSKHCEASACATPEANLCYDFLTILTGTEVAQQQHPPPRRAAWKPDPDIREQLWVSLPLGMDHGIAWFKAADVVKSL